MKNFITCDIGKKTVTVFNPIDETHRVVSTDSFRDLEISEINDGMTIVIEDAHLRSQEDNSLAHTYKIDELRKLRSKADEKNIEILCFPQKVTPKARKLFTLSLGKTEVIDKTDKNDTQAIAFYLSTFPNIFKSLKKFKPMTFDDHDELTSHIYADRLSLTEDSNTARNENYGIGKDNDYENEISKWIKKYITVLYSRLDEDTREYFKLTLNSKGNALSPGILNYTSASVLKQIYNVVNTIITPEGERRLRSDNGKPPYWKYAKTVYFGLTPYHMHAGVTASNYKFHKRKAGSRCKKSMSFDSAKVIKDVDEVHEIRNEMKYADRCLRTLWRTIRKMIIEDELR